MRVGGQFLLGDGGLFCLVSDGEGEVWVGDEGLGVGKGYALLLVF